VETLKSDLQLTPETLGGIFQGSIGQWNLVRSDLPVEEIRIVHRRDGSGTTRVLSEFLNLRSKAWKRGVGWYLPWPAHSRGVYGNDEVAKAVAATPYSIGYVEYGYAVANHLRHAWIQNNAKQLVQASPESIAAAISSLPRANDAQELARAILEDKAARRGAYPLSTLTWVLMPLQPGPGLDAALLGPSGFFTWTLTPAAQAFTEPLGYVPLTPELLAWEQRELSR